MPGKVKTVKQSVLTGVVALGVMLSDSGSCGHDSLGHMLTKENDWSQHKACTTHWSPVCVHVAVAGGWTCCVGTKVAVPVSEADDVVHRVHSGVGNVNVPPPVGQHGIVTTVLAPWKMRLKLWRAGHALARRSN